MRGIGGDVLFCEKKLFCLALVGVPCRPRGKEKEAIMPRAYRASLLPPASRGRDSGLRV